MEGLIDGKFDIAMTAIDNLIAYMEGEGEAKTEATPNIVAVMGSDNGFLSLVTAPGIQSFAALRGRRCRSMRSRPGTPSCWRRC